MIQRCGKHLNFQLLTKASYFDKQYSKLSFVDKMGFMDLEDEVLDKEAILEQIKIELLLVQEKINAAQQDPSESVIDKPAKKKTKFLSMACEGGDSVGGSEESGGDRVCDAVSEMNRYSKEKTMKADSDILQ